MRWSLATLATLLISLSGCRTEPLPLDVADGAVSICVAAGGRCARRAPNGVSACSSDENTLSGGPDYCGDPAEDCCIQKCPATRPEPGDSCHVPSSCQYRDPDACVQAICIGGSWNLQVGACPGG